MHPVDGALDHDPGLQVLQPAGAYRGPVPAPASRDEQRGSYRAL